MLKFIKKSLSRIDRLNPLRRISEKGVVERGDTPSVGVRVFRWVSLYIIGCWEKNWSVSTAAPEPLAKSKSAYCVRSSNRGSPINKPSIEMNGSKQPWFIWSGYQRFWILAKENFMPQPVSWSLYLRIQIHEAVCSTSLKSELMEARTLRISEEEKTAPSHS